MSMRTSNNISSSSESMSSDQIWYVVFDTDTQEYLVEWDDWEEGTEVWRSMDLWGDEGVEEFGRFQSGALCTSPEAAADLLLAVGESLCERFPDDLINLVVQKVKVIVARSLDVEDHGEVQSFGEVPDEEEEEEECEDLTPEPRSWTITRDDDDEPKLESSFDGGWSTHAASSALKPKKPKGSKKAKKASRR